LDAGRLEVNGDDWFFSLRGEGEFLDDILRLSGVGEMERSMTLQSRMALTISWLHMVETSMPA
tara:strand:- start:149 stop:337 length:189 start_codon:yes stop_codon:yes gene_type:complete